MRIVFMGTPDFAVPSLNALIESDDDVVAVITNPDRPAGRGRKEPLPSPVKSAALKHDIPVLQPSSVRKRAFRKQFAALKPDLAVVIAYGKILPQSVLDIPTFGCINVHASILPKLRGSAPINWAIARGFKTTGVTTMKMDVGMDTGDMLFVDSVIIAPGQTAGELHDQLSHMGVGTLTRTLRALKEGTLKPIPQDHEQATHAPMLSKNDGNIDWSQTAQEIVGRIHGFNPWPGTFTHVASSDNTRLVGARFKIHRARVINEHDAHGTQKPGTIVQNSSGSVIVATGAGCVALLECQAPGRRKMPVDTWQRGFDLPVGSWLSQQIPNNA